MNTIKFIYFDVGGVLLRDFTNTSKMSELKADLGITDSTEEVFESIWQKHKNRMCLDFDVDLIAAELRQKTDLLIPNNYSMLNSFIDRFEQNSSIWPVLDLAKQRNKMGLLTNQYPRMLKEIMKRNLMPKIDWDVVIDSSLVGFQKPDKQIFMIAEEKSGVKPEEILFVDNLLQNTEVAKKIGWQVFLYDDQNMEIESEKLVDLFSKY